MLILKLFFNDFKINKNLGEKIQISVGGNQLIKIIIIIVPPVAYESSSLPIVYPSKGHVHKLMEDF